MKTLNQLISNPLVLIFLFAAPVVLKWAFTGAIGVEFQFYFVFGWLPLLALLYSVRFGVKMIAATIVIFTVAAGLLYLNYPENPPMDLRRQLLHEGTPVMAIAFAMTFLGQIAFRMSRQS